MIRYLTAPLLWLLLASLVSAQVKIVGPTKVSGGALVRLSASGIDLSPRTRVVWKVTGLSRDKDGKAHSADVERIPILSEPDDKGKVTIVGYRLAFSGPSGDYRVDLRIIDFKAELFEEAEVVVTIGNGVPPGPGPGPLPPTPPVPPEPASALAKKLKPILDAEASANKKPMCQALAAVYAEGAAQVKKGAPKTMGQLWKQLEAGAAAVKVDGQILSVQTAVAEYIVSKIPSKSSAVIDDANRELIAATLADVAAALREVSK